MSLTKALQLEKRFQKPLAEIVTESVSKTQSIAVSADLLGLNRATMRGMVDYLGLRGLLVDDTPARKASGKVVGEMSAKYRVEFNGVMDSVFAHCRRLGLKTANVYRNINGGMSPAEALERAYQRRARAAA